MRRRCAITLTGVSLLAVVLTGCGGSGGDASHHPSTGSTTSSSPSPTSDPTTVATADAKRALSRYLKVRGELSMHPKNVVARLAKVAAGQELETWSENYQAWAARGWHATAAPTVTITSVDSVSMDDSDPSHGKAPTVHLSACFHVGKVDVVDAAGKSQVAKGRKPTSLYQFVVLNPSYTRDPRGGWRVVDSSGGSQTC